MSEHIDGNTGWQVNDDGDVIAPDDGVFPLQDHQIGPVNVSGMRHDPEYSAPIAGQVAAETQDAEPADPLIAEPTRIQRKPKRPFEMPGQNRNGRTNGPGLATRAEAQKGMTDAEIDQQQEINTRGAAAARRMLRGETEEDSI